MNFILQIMWVVKSNGFHQALNLKKIKLNVIILTLLSLMIHFQFFPKRAEARTISIQNLWQSLGEEALLKMIDHEFAKIFQDEKNMEWSEEYGIQPTDTYELDYAEKCRIILESGSKNKKILQACRLIL